MVLVVAYRKKVMSDSVRKRCVEIIENIASGFDVQIMEADGNADHIHLLLAANAKISVNLLIRLKP